MTTITKDDARTSFSFYTAKRWTSTTFQDNCELVLCRTIENSKIFGEVCKKSYYLTLYCLASLTIAGSPVSGVIAVAGTHVRTNCIVTCTIDNVATMAAVRTLVDIWPRDKKLKIAADDVMILYSHKNLKETAKWLPCRMNMFCVFKRFVF